MLRLRLVALAAALVLLLPFPLCSISDSVDSTSAPALNTAAAASKAAGLHQKPHRVSDRTLAR